jgi:hypothetical protein
LTTSDPEEQGKTAPIKLPATVEPAAADAGDKATLADSPPSPVAEPHDVPPLVVPHETAWSPPPRPVTEPRLPEAEAPAVPPLAVTRLQPDVLYVPMAVSIGDGFKFGCGFFLALVLAMLVGFVLLAALFLLTTLFGLNLPITR